MNKEEAIKAIQDFIGWFKTDSRIYKALKMAIQALSQVAICPSAGVDCEDCPAYEPCEDASRDFHIGDEVRIIGSDPIYDDCDVGWVIRNASEKVKTMYVMRNDGSAGEEAKAEWYKTGRHNAMLAEVIKALPSVTQKPIECDDAVSRESVDRILRDMGVNCAYDMPSFWANKGKDYKVIPTKWHKGYQQAVADFDKRIRELPSVTQKSGKWIKVKSGDKDFPESIVCSRCNNENSHLDFNENAEPIGKVFVTSKYCPNCGAKMESEVQIDAT